MSVPNCQQVKLEALNLKKHIRHKEKKPKETKQNNQARQSQQIELFCFLKCDFIDKINYHCESLVTI